MERGADELQHTERRALRNGLPGPPGARSTAASPDRLRGGRTFLLDLGDGYLVSGAGRAHGDLVRFHEKDMEHNGKDIRVWHVRQEGADFLAEQAATF